MAEEHTGLPAADLQFESVAPVSAPDGALWSQTVAFTCRQLAGSEISAILAQQLTRLAAAALLQAFPNTTLTAAYFPGPGPVPPAAVRRAAAFIDAHAGQPVTVAEIAAAAGVTARALQYAFRRYYDTTPAGCLRRIRLTRAHRQLQAADPATRDRCADRPPLGLGQPGQFRHRLPQAVRDVASPHAARLSLAIQPGTHQRPVPRLKALTCGFSACQQVCRCGLSRAWQLPRLD